MNDWQELTTQLRNIVRGRANEVSHQLSINEVNQIRDLLGNLEMLEDDLRSFEEIIDGAWDKVEQF